MLEPFSAMCSPMRPAMLIYVKNCIFSFWGLHLKPPKVDFRAIFQKKIDFILKPVGFYYFLALFWPPRPSLISKKPPACNAGHFSIKNLYFWPQLIHFITFLAKNTSFWGPNLTYGKPDTYDPLIPTSKNGYQTSRFSTFDTNWFISSHFLQQINHFGPQTWLTANLTLTIPWFNQSADCVLWVRML